METSLSWLGRLVEAPDHAEWQRLSDIYGPLVASWVEHADVAPADIDDVVQEVLIVVSKRVNEFEHQRPGAFRAWLRAILSNQLKKYFRENPRSKCRISLERICDPMSADSQLFDREHDQYIAARAMRIVAREFEPNTWKAFQWQVIDGQSSRDVAATLGSSINAVIKSKSRVLRRLREYLCVFVDD